MKSIWEKLSLTVASVLCVIMSACADHDDPELDPIDTSKVKITASIDTQPAMPWLNPTEEMTIRVSDVEMLAPKGVVLRSISLCEGGRTILDKPFSGEELEFKIPLTYINGRVNFSVIGNLIQKKSRDAQIIIEDNIQRIVFSQTPEFACEGSVRITVKSISTSGEEYTNSFDVNSIGHSAIPVPQSELYWSPASGTASTLELTLEGGAKAWSTNSTLECSAQRIYWVADNGPVLKMSIPNSPGALDKQKLQLYVVVERFGVYEGVTVESSDLMYVFGLVESK